MWIILSRREPNKLYGWDGLIAFKREARLGLRFSFLLSALFNKGFRYFDAGIET